MGAKRAKARAKPRGLAWVKIDIGGLHESERQHYEQYRGRQFIFLGEIPNQPGHSLIAELGGNGERHERSGVILIVVHTDDLVELTEDET